jgi:dihydrofolate reductase
MRKISVFNNISLDGYMEGPNHDLSWAKNDFEAFTPERSQATGALLFGHTTYAMMKSFWPTPQAAQLMPEVARFMNDTPKIVVSHTAFEPGWQNVSVLSGDGAAEVKKLKEQPGKDMLIFGSNTLCTALLQAGLLDEIQVVLNPVLIGQGTPLFLGLAPKAELTLIETHPYKSGAILLTYLPRKTSAPA